MKGFDFNNDELQRKIRKIILIGLAILIFFGRYALYILIFLAVFHLIKYLAKNDIEKLKRFNESNLGKSFGFNKKFNFNNVKDKKMSDNVVDATPVGEYMKNAGKGVAGIVTLIITGLLIAMSIKIVDAGQTGVYSLFGKVKDEELSSGMHFVIPLAKITKMSVRTEEYTMSIAQGEGKRVGADAITSLTKEGLSVDLDMTVLYRLDEKKAASVYKNVGLQYDEKIIRPAIRTSIRDIVAQYEAKDIYSEKRQEVADKIQDALKGNLDERGILVEDVLLRNVALPAKLTGAIQAKLEAEQEAQKYEFLLQKEEKEKQRKKVEAEGQRDAQKIINESLTDDYLYYMYIQNLKDRPGTIYVPTSPNTGMPMFKNLGN